MMQDVSQPLLSHRARAALVLITALATACGASKAKLATPGGPRMELLDGRLAFTPSATAELEPRPHDVMGAPTSAAEESRVILVPGEPYAHFVLLANETFATMPTDPAAAKAAISAFLGDGAIGEVTLADGATAIEYLPRPSSHDGPRLVYAALVTMADRTVIELDYYVLPEDDSDRAAWVSQARALTATMTRGTRAIDRSARTVTFEGLALDAPADTSFTAQPGPDFAVYRLRTIGPLGSPATIVGVYLGGHPSYQHAQAEDGASAVTTEAGTLLGTAVEWHRWTHDGVEYREAIVARGEHNAIHAFRLAPPGDARGAELDAALGTLREAP